MSGQVAPGTVQPRDLAAWLPADTVLWLEADDLRSTMRALHTLAGALPPRLALAEATLAAALRFTLGVDLDGLLQVMAPGPAALGIVVPARGHLWPVVLSRITDLEAAQQLAERLPHAAIEVRDGLCALLPDAATLQRWRSFVAGDEARLAERRRAQPAPTELARGGLRLFVDLALLHRRRGTALWEPLDPGARVLLGPWVAALDAASRLDAAVAVGADGVHLHGMIDASPLARAPQADLLACGAALRPRLSLPPDTLAVLDLDRSLYGYLTHLDALLPPSAAAQVRSEAANLDLLIGGGSFVDDLLAGLAEPVRLVVVGAPPTPADDGDRPRPRLDLPGIALVAKVETERARTLLIRGFYRLSAVLTGQRVQRHLPPRLAQRVDEDGLHLHVMRGPAFQGVGEPPTGEQIEATLVFGHGHAVLATTPGCARQVLAALACATDATLCGDAMLLRGAPIADYLRRNQSAMVAGRVLDEGESKSEANRFVEGVLDVLGLLAQAELKVSPAAHSTDVHPRSRASPSMNLARGDDRLRPFTPTAEHPFDLRLAGHLARRAGFGASLAVRRRWVARGVEFAVAEVSARAPGEDLDALFPDVLATDDIEWARAYRVARALVSACPLAERVALFWHGHFATSHQKVQSARLMLRQLALFDAQGLGRFDDLLLAVSRDPAMLRWLDADRNVKERPNENFARELFELFALGRLSYGEDDVRQAARAFTGWRERHERFVELRQHHDAAAKQVLGVTGVRGGEDVVAVAAARPRSAEFLAARWLQAFVHPQPTAAEVTALAREYTAQDRDVGGTLRTLLASELFFARRSYRSQVKAPLDYVVGLVRSAGARASPSALARATSRLGQVLFEPPSVEGWPRDKSWLNSATWLGRANFAATLFGSGDHKLRPDATALLAQATGAEDRAALAIDLLLDGDVSPASRRAVVDVARQTEAASAILRATACLPEAHLL